MWSGICGSPMKTPQHRKDACELAQAMQIPNLVLWHTEDSNVAGRERLYKSEGKKYYGGNIFVPDDESPTPCNGRRLLFLLLGQLRLPEPMAVTVLIYRQGPFSVTQTKFHLGLVSGL